MCLKQYISCLGSRCFLRCACRSAVRAWKKKKRAARCGIPVETSFSAEKPRIMGYEYQHHFFFSPTLTSLAANHEGSAISSILHDPVAKPKSTLSMAALSTPTKKTRDSTMRGTVGYIRTRRIRYEQPYAPVHGLRRLPKMQRERDRCDMIYHLVHCIVLNQLGQPIKATNGHSYKQALARPIIMSQTPYSILDLGCGTGIWASDMAT